MTETYDWENESQFLFEADSPSYDPDFLAAFPPSLESSAQGSTYLVRFALLGLAFGLLAALSVVQLAWWLSLSLAVLWVLGWLALAIFAPLKAKEHRGGVGYPADPAAWVRSFSRVVNVGTVVLGLLGLLAALAVDLGIADADATRTFNATPNVLLLIVAVLAIFCVRWLVANKLIWLIYGSR